MGAVQSRRRRTPGIGIMGPVAVLAFAALVGAGVVTATDSAPVPEEDPVVSLVAAFERSRTATYRAEGVFTRSAPDGRSLSAEVATVQRRPDRLVRQFGSVTGRRDDRVLSCPAPADGGPLRCGLGPPGPSFDEVVAAEVAGFAALFAGEDPLYEVRRLGPECWRMTRTRFDPRSGYGVEAEVCVDAALGALRRLAVDHGDITELTTWTERSATVTDADLEP